MDRARELTFRYAPNFCEENIYHLASDLEIMSGNGWVLFMSNEGRRVAMLEQRSRPGGVVLWDYHVVLATRYEKWMIWDLDTILPLPSDAANYLRRCFSEDTPSEYTPLIKFVRSDLYIEEFYSDRRHMLDAHGHFIVPPPSWPAIRGEKGSSLESYLDMKNSTCGTVRTVSGAIEFFSQCAESD